MVVLYKSDQTANLRGFRPSVTPRFDDGIPDFIKTFNTFKFSCGTKICRQNPKLKNPSSMPALVINILV